LFGKEALDASPVRSYDHRHGCRIRTSGDAWLDKARAAPPLPSTGQEAMQITSSHARAVIAAGAAKADEIGAPMNIAVLDGGGHLKAFARMDGAVLGSIDIALKKAKTAVLFGMNSEAVGEFCKPGAPAATNDVLGVFAGGIPVRNEAGEVIGGVGVSDGAVDQDYAVALAAAAAPIT
jgi:uncharacterized protein GlcG (DUF336 family)